MVRPPPPAHTWPARLFAVTRVLSIASFRNAAKLALPFYFGLLLLASVLFGPQGLEAKTVLTAFQRSPALALIAWAAWLLFTLPIARAALRTPESAFFRSLPIPRGHFLFIMGLHLFTIEFPWALLWARGAGPRSINAWPALGAFATAAAAHALLIAQDRGVLSVASALLLLPVALYAAKNPIVFFTSIPVLIAGLITAHRRAHERKSRARHLWIPKNNSAAALGLTYLYGIARGNSSVFSRALFTALTGALIVPFAARGYSIESPASLSGLSLGIASAFMFIAIDGISSAILRIENQMRWILDSNSIGKHTRVLAASGAASFCGAILGALHGATALAVLRSGVASDNLIEFISNPSNLWTLALRLILLSCFLGFCEGALCDLNTRLSNWDIAKKEGRSLVRALVFIACASFAWSSVGERTLIAFLPLVAMAAWKSARLALRPAPPLQRHTHAQDPNTLDSI